jgi:hypothetical protein
MPIASRIGSTIANAVALGLPWRHAGFFLQEADHHADRQIVFDRVAAKAVDESSRPVCWDQQQPRLPVNDRPAQIPDALVLLADAMNRGSSSLAKAVRSRPSLVVISGHRNDELESRSP